MTIAFNPAELAHLGRAMRLLSSPLDHASTDEWRHAVNEEVKALIGADSAGFLLTGDGRMPMLSRDHDVEELSRFPEMAVPTLPDGSDPWARIVAMGAGRLADAYGDSYRKRYLGSAYHNDYAGANGANDPLLLCSVLQGPGTPIGLACLHMWQASPRRTFGEREVAIMRLLQPAFVAGVHAQVHWSSVRRDVISLLDRLGTAAVVWSCDGATLHHTPALAGLIRTDGAVLVPALASTLDALRPLARGHQMSDALDRSIMREVRGTTSYRVRGTLYGGEADGQRMVIATVDRTTAPLRTADELRSSHRLTPAECRVAHELAQGRSNAAIAERLGVSPHTVRRHTERVFAKLGARSRAEAITLLIC